MFKEKIYLGLDISDLSLKIAKVKKQGNSFKLEELKRIPLKKGIIENGIIKQPAIFEQNITKTCIQCKTKNIACSLPENKIFSKIIQIKKNSLWPLRQTIKKQLAQIIPLPINKVYLDSQIIKKEKNSYKILIAAAPRKLVDSYLEILQKTECKVQALEIESIATARALIKKNNKIPVFIIDTGALRTSFIIVYKNVIQFTASKPISNNSLVDIISKELQVSKKDAKKLKRNIGLDKKYKGLYKALTVPLSDLAQTAQNYISFFETHINNKQKIGKILLCGGGANLKGLDEFLESKINIPVRIGGYFIDKDKLSYAVAIGLAIGHKRKINLLPLKFKKALHLEKSSQKLGIIFISIFIASLMFCAGIFILQFLINTALLSSSLTSQHSAFAKSQEDLAKNIEKAETLLKRINQVSSESNNLTLILQDIKNNTSKNIILVNLYINELEKKVVIKGQAITRQDLLEFENSLTHYKNLDSPLSNFVKDKNIDFNLSFVYE